MKVLPNYFKFFAFPIYYLIHSNYIFGFIQKKFFKNFKYKEFIFSINGLKFPISFYSSFLCKTYELNDRVLVERNLSNKNKCIIIGGGIGFIATIAYHLTNQYIAVFEINKNIIPILRKNLSINNVKSRIFSKNLSLTKKFVKNYYFTGNNFLSNSAYRVTKHKKKFFNIHFSKIANFHKFNTLIIDGEGIEEHFINNLEKIKNIHHIFFELHHDIFNKNKINNLLNKLKNHNFKLKDKFVNSYYFVRKKN
jgi:FkbM family methyltransferase